MTKNYSVSKWPNNKKTHVPEGKNRRHIKKDWVMELKEYGMANSIDKLKQNIQKFSKSFTEYELFSGKLNNN